MKAAMGVLKGYGVTLLDNIITCNKNGNIANDSASECATGVITSYIA